MQHRLAYPVPTIWFAALVAASGLALFAWPGRSWVALGVVEVLLVLVFVADAVLCVAPRRIDVQREIDESVTLGEETTLPWLFANRAARLAREVGAAPQPPRSVPAARRHGSRRRPATTGQPSSHPCRRGRGARDAGLPQPGGRAATHSYPAGAGGGPAQCAHRRGRQGVRPAARLPARRRVPAHRLAGHGAPAAPDRQAVPRRTQPERGAAAGQRPCDGRHRRRRAARGTCDGRRAGRGAGGHQAGRQSGNAGLRPAGPQHPRTHQRQEPVGSRSGGDVHASSRRCCLRCPPSLAATWLWWPRCKTRR